MRSIRKALAHRLRNIATRLDPIPTGAPREQGGITLSCGHEVARLEDSFRALIKAQWNDGSPAIESVVVCGDCFEWYCQDGSVLFTHEQQDAYLMGKED